MSRGAVISLGERLQDYTVLHQEIMALPCIYNPHKDSQWLFDSIHTALYDALKDIDPRVELWMASGLMSRKETGETLCPEHVHAQHLYLKIPAEGADAVWTLEGAVNECAIFHITRKMLKQFFKRNYPQHTRASLTSSVSHGEVSPADLDDFRDEVPGDLTQLMRSFFERRQLEQNTEKTSNTAGSKRL
jgi:hypothetical protein